MSIDVLDLYRTMSRRTRNSAYFSATFSSSQSCPFLGIRCSWPKSRIFGFLAGGSWFKKFKQPWFFPKPCGDLTCFAQFFGHPGMENARLLPSARLQSCSRELRNFFEIRPVGRGRRELPAQELWQLWHGRQFGLVKAWAVRFLKKDWGTKLLYDFVIFFMWIIFSEMNISHLHRCKDCRCHGHFEVKQHRTRWCALRECHGPAAWAQKRTCCGGIFSTHKKQTLDK